MKYFVEACIAPGVRKWVLSMNADTPEAAIAEARSIHAGRGYCQFWAMNDMGTVLLKEEGEEAAKPS
jgi:hypothetical protein